MSQSLPAAPSPEQLAQRALNLVKPGEDAHRSRVKTYDSAYKVWRGLSDTTAGDPWQSKLRVKYAMQVLDTALVNIITGGKPRCLVRPRQPNDELNAKKMQAAMDYYVAEDHFVEKQPLFVQQGLIYGVTVAKNHWFYKETVRMGRQPVTNPMTGQPYLAAMPQQVIERDGPSFEPWNVYDAWWDPNARDVDTSRYFVLRSWSTMDDLRANEFNSDTGQGIYRNLDQLAKAGPGKRRDTSAQERYLGGDANKRKGMVELLEVWHVVGGEVYVAVIGNRQVLLRYDQSPYWHGRFPIVVANTRPDGFELQGIPETDLVDHLQQALWTNQNMRFDNLHLTVMRGITYREGGVADPNALVLKPRFKWGVSDHDDVQFRAPDPLPPEAYREQQELLGQLQLVTGINPFVSGAQQQGVDQNTATGVSVLSEVASRLLRFKAAQIQYRGYQRSFEMWGAMIQQFLDRQEAVKINGDDGNEQWHQFGPADVVGNFHYVLEGTEEALSKSQERSEAIALLNAVGPLFQFGIVKPQPILERVASAYNMDPGSLIAPPPPQQQLPPAAPGGQQPQAQPLLNGNQLIPSVASAITQGR